MKTEGVSDDDDDDYSGEVAMELVKCPDKNELLQVIETLQRFSLFLDKGDTIQSYASRIESQVDQHFAKKKKKKKQAFIVLNSEKDVSFVFRKNPNFTSILVNSNIR